MIQSLASRIGLGALAALLVSVPDGLLLALAGAGASLVVGLAALHLLFGLLVGLLVFVLLLASYGLQHLREQAPAAHWLDGVVALVPAAPLSWHVFSGAGMQRSWLGDVGPWILMALLGAGAVMLSWAARRWLPPAHARVSARVALGGAASLALSACLGLNAAYYPHGYEVLHLALLVVAVGFGMLALACLPRAWPVGPIGWLLALVSVPLLVGFPSAEQQVWLSQGRTTGVRIAELGRALYDLDGDGYSPVLGGGDCDDSDGQVHPGARDRPGDGSDQNCDGRDGSTIEVLPTPPFELDLTRAAQITGAATARPTVLLVVDTLRGDRVGRPEFANIKTLADESIAFTQVFASSSATATSVPGILSGRVRPSASDPPLGKRLSAVGKRAAYVGMDVVVETVRGQMPVDTVFEFRAFEGFDPLHIINTNHDRGWGGSIRRYTSDEVTAIALDILEQARPDLLVVHYFDLHQWNHIEADGLAPKGDFSRYDAVLARVDAALSPWLARKHEINLVLTSDHGEALGRNGLESHTKYVFREVTHVPLLIRIPGQTPSTVATPLGLTALTATLAQMCGAPARADAPVRNLFGLVGVAEPGPGPGFGSFEEYQWGLTHDHYRLLYFPKMRIAELFDITADPLERRNLVGQYPELAGSMLRRLHELSPPTR